MRLSPHHPVFAGMFHYKPSTLGYPHLWKPPYGKNNQQNVAFHASYRQVNDRRNEIS